MERSLRRWIFIGGLVRGPAQTGQLAGNQGEHVPLLQFLHGLARPVQALEPPLCTAPLPPGERGQIAPGGKPAQIVFQPGLGETILNAGLDAVLGEQQAELVVDQVVLLLFLAVGFIGAILPFMIGMFVGSVAGWFGGWVDMVIMRVIDIGLCIPSMIYVILILVYFGGGPQAIIIALAVMNWMGPARGYRGRILQFKNREFTLAAETLGATPMRIIYRHILPNILGNIVVSLTSFVPAAIFMEASLAFIGLGIAPPMTSLGQLASDGAGMYRTHFYQFIIPSLVISLIIFAFFMLGNCLRDALDPQLRDEMSTSALRKRRRAEQLAKSRKGAVK